MDTFSDDTEENQFFDAVDYIPSNPDFKDWHYDVWINTPRCVTDRRRKFVRWMGLYSNELEEENSVHTFDNRGINVFQGDSDRIMNDAGAVLRTSSSVDELSSSGSPSSWNTDDLESTQGVDLCECIREGVNSCIDVVNNETLGNLQFPLHEEVENVGQFSPSVHRIVDRKNEVKGSKLRRKNRMRDSWLCKLRSLTCLANGNVKDHNMELNAVNQIQGRRFRRVGVRHNRRRLKELSALFTKQDIQAHDGAILTMKFSLDGKYMATAGEDKLVKVWKVVENERLDAMDIPEVDPSCLYFSVNQDSELKCLNSENDMISKSKTFQKTRDSACIIFPQIFFQLQETPLHVFQGHDREILDLSWSNSNYLLSSSVDKTVRLWRIGDEQCLKVFQHSDYVTCIQFNPVNDDFFVSGSIDGKIRLWAISSCQVVAWIEIRDIITAVSYHPDGQGGVFGSITGTCHFFGISGNHLQLETQMCLISKKKSSPCKRITGFQFLPQDPSKVLVTCADSHVRIVEGTNVVAKYKGLRNAGNHFGASFTPDGTHIISASEDSNVYVWNYLGQEEYSFLHPKVTRSFECFSADASIAISWPSLRIEKSEERLKSGQVPENSIKYFPFSPSTRILLNQELFLDFSSKGAATWPEENLPVSDTEAITSSMSKSQYKLFKTSWMNLSSSHAWGLVIVTASWDGRIRSFYNYGLPAPL